MWHALPAEILPQRGLLLSFGFIALASSLHRYALHELCEGMSRHPARAKDQARPSLPPHSLRSGIMFRVLHSSVIPHLPPQSSLRSPLHIMPQLQPTTEAPHRMRFSIAQQAHSEKPHTSVPPLRHQFHSFVTPHMPPPSVPLPEPGIKCCPHCHLRFILPPPLHCVSSLAAWTPLAGSLDPSLLQRPSR